MRFAKKRIKTIKVVKLKDLSAFYKREQNDDKYKIMRLID